MGFDPKSGDNFFRYLNFWVKKYLKKLSKLGTLRGRGVKLNGFFIFWLTNSNTFRNTVVSFKKTKSIWFHQPKLCLMGFCKNLQLGRGVLNGFNPLVVDRIDYFMIPKRGGGVFCGEKVYPTPPLRWEALRYVCSAAMLTRRRRKSLAIIGK